MLNNNYIYAFRDQKMHNLIIIYIFQDQEITNLIFIVHNFFIFVLNTNITQIKMSFKVKNHSENCVIHSSCLF